MYYNIIFLVVKNNYFDLNKLTKIIIILISPVYPPFLFQITKVDSHGYAFVMEYIDMSGLSQYGELLGEQLAK